MPRVAFELLRKYVRSRRAKKSIPDFQWREVCVRACVPLDAIQIQPNEILAIRLAKSVIHLTKCLEAFSILAAYKTLYEIDAYTNCAFAWDADSAELVASVGEATYKLRCREEVFILSELILSGDYDFVPVGPAVILDIGANVGFASIFLADLNKECLVESYEPLSVNYQRAIHNIAANGHLTNRIRVHNFGLYFEDGVVAISSELESRGRSSIVFDRASNSNKEVEVEQVKVVRASTVIEDIRRQYPDREIVIKMDCEGSEYPIIEELISCDKLRYINFVVMEWHRSSAENNDLEKLREALVKNGFNTYVRGRLQYKELAGMAIAFRSIF